MPESIPSDLTDLLGAESPSTRDQAWGRLLESVTPIVMHICRSLGGGRDATMDRYASVVEGLREQDFHRLRTFDPARGAKFTTWLAVVARRLCAEHERRKFGRVRGEAPGEITPELLLRRRLVLGISAEVDLSMMSDADDSAPPGESEERAAALAQAVAQLPARDQLLLQFRFEGGYTATDIAGLLGFPSPFHVYRRLRVVLAQLRERLKVRGIGRD